MIILKMMTGLAARCPVAMACGGLWLAGLALGTADPLFEQMGVYPAQFFKVMMMVLMCAAAVILVSGPFVDGQAPSAKGRPEDNVAIRHDKIAKDDDMICGVCIHPADMSCRPQSATMMRCDTASTTRSS